MEIFREKKKKNGVFTGGKDFFPTCRLLTHPGLYFSGSKPFFGWEDFPWSLPAMRFRTHRGFGLFTGRGGIQWGSVSPFVLLGGDCKKFSLIRSGWAWIWEGFQRGDDWTPFGEPIKNALRGGETVFLFLGSFIAKTMCPGWRPKTDTFLLDLTRTKFGSASH